MHLLKQFKYTDDNVIHITKSRSLEKEMISKVTKLVYLTKMQSSMLLIINHNSIVWKLAGKY